MTAPHHRTHSLSNDLTVRAPGEYAFLDAADGSLLIPTDRLPSNMTAEPSATGRTVADILSTLRAADDSGPVILHRLLGAEVETVTAASAVELGAQLILTSGSGLFTAEVLDGRLNLHLGAATGMELELRHAVGGRIRADHPAPR